jgi:hypothetical protein
MINQAGMLVVALFTKPGKRLFRVVKKKSIMLLNRALTFSIKKQDLANLSKALEK